jgi:hypothetical protein
MITNIGGAAFACTGLALCLGLAGCDAASNTGIAIATSPAGLAFAGAVLTAAPARSNDFALCVGGGFFRPGLTLVVTSARATVSVDRVTLHMLDGTNLGGPGVTVGQSQLDGGAPTVIRAGTSRTFGLTPVFACGVSAPRTVHADVDVVEAGGTRTVIRATAALP